MGPKIKSATANCVVGRAASETKKTSWNSNETTTLVEGFIARKVKHIAT
jgi:hypothetical protein